MLKCVKQIYVWTKNLHQQSFVKKIDTRVSVNFAPAIGIQISNFTIKSTLECHLTLTLLTDLVNKFKSPNFEYFDNHF